MDVCVPLHVISLRRAIQALRWVTLCQGPACRCTVMSQIDTDPV